MNALTILTFSALSWTAIGAWLANHLWQSTVFAGVVWLLTLLLRNNRAETRYSLWLIASAKFLLPFSVLIGLGSRIAWPKAPAAAPSSVFIMTQVFSEPFAPVSPPSVAAPTPDSTLLVLLRSLPFLLLIVWSCGCAAMLFLWWRRRRRLTMTMRGALRVEAGRELETLRRLEQSAGLIGQIELRISESALEPGVLGIFRPVLLLPKGISGHLTDAQLEAILTHELCHVRRSDNLAAGFHMLVEAVFWFHPLVWWIGARLVDERERACDEEVLNLGSDPQAYAEGILKVCEFCVESPLFCAAGVTGSDLKKRIEAIMSNRIAPKVDLAKKLLLSTMGVAALLGPIAFGLIHAPQSRAQAQPQNDLTIAPVFETAWIKPNTTGEPPDAMTQAFQQVDPVFNVKGRPMLGPMQAIIFRFDKFLATNMTLKALIRAAYNVQNSQITGGPDWLDTEKFDVSATIGSSQMDELRKLGPDEASLERLRMLQNLLADRFKLALHRETREHPSYALVVAPGGPKLQVAQPGDTYTNGMKDGNGRPFGAGMVVAPGPGKLVGQGVPIDVIVHELSQHYPDGTVVDKTGLTAKYDFTLQWSPHAGQDPDHTPPILAAIRDQLGLTLELQNNPVEVLVIDHAEQLASDELPSSQLQPQTQNVAESSAAFVTISIKPNTTGELMRANAGRPRILREMRFEPNRFMATNVTLHGLIAAAYGAAGSEILGGPDWVHSENYDVEAKLGMSEIEELNKLGPDQRILEKNRILQALLADRFRLTLHRETREPPAYALAIARDGFKLQEPKPGDTYPDGFKDPQGHPLGAGVLFQPGPCKLVGQGVHLVDLAKTLSVNFLGGRTVIDQTGLGGVYDFTLDCHIALMERGESVLRALPEQLGLELKPLDVLVIDHAEQITGDESSQTQP